MKTAFLVQQNLLSRVVEGLNWPIDAIGTGVALQTYTLSAHLSILTRERTPNTVSGLGGYDMYVFRLTREVRLHVSTDPAAAGKNGHSGFPAVSGAFYPIDVRITLEGMPDSQSGYVRNIKEVDDGVSKLGLPLLRQRLFDAACPPYEVLASELFGQLRGAWPGVWLAELALRPSAGTTYQVFAEGVAMQRLSHRFEFSAAHRLHNPELNDAENKRLFGKCNNPLGHGHNYEVQVTLQSNAGTFPPIAQLEQLVDMHAIDRLDHKNLNQEVDAFKNVNPSVEQIAKVIYGWLKPPLTLGGASLASVTVWETPRTWCEYSE